MPSILNDLLDARLRELIVQWNVAERRIKQAENARAQEVVASAIFELRYAGRKVVDVIQIAQSNDWRTDPEISEKLHAYIDDAIEDCVKAKHDAIDAVISFVVRWFNEHERKLGLSYLHKCFPTYLEVTAKIADIQEKIEESRQNRTQKRDGLYDEIEIDGYDAILNLYQQMRLSEKRINRIIRTEKLAWYALWFFGVTGFVIGILALGAALFPHYFVIYP